MSQIVQYIIVRSDLRTHLKWPIGAIIAQACHASTAINHLCSSDADVICYLSDLDNMRKIVLSVADESSLQEVDRILTENKILHKMWVEQPENIATCIAVKPHNKSDIHKYFKKLKLFDLSGC